MRHKHKFIALGSVFFLLIIITLVFISRHNVAVLNPKGVIASQERDLIVASTVLMMLVVVPVLVMTLIIAWKYRASNKAAKYSPDWDHNGLVEFAWWAIPSVIILVLSIMTWNSSHNLDPFKPLSAEARPIKIQVVALQWRWLFIYPEQGIATVNYLQVPNKTPINFEITSDAPMNSLWIPQLGGQIYAMAGMSTKLHLMADKIGSYQGSSANLSGEGFAGMHFTLRSSTQAGFDNWLQQVKKSPNTLNLVTYAKLAQPNKISSPIDYSVVTNGLYDDILGKYMQPGYSLPANAFSSSQGASL